MVLCVTSFLTSHQQLDIFQSYQGCQLILAYLIADGTAVVVFDDDDDDDEIVISNKT